ncbi:hypothetical protein [Erwinia phage vB_Ea_2910A]|nr:hypothetical protein [Erwinia phage vB_Ea_2910A]
MLRLRHIELGDFDFAHKTHLRNVVVFADHFVRSLNLRAVHELTLYVSNLLVDRRVRQVELKQVVDISTSTCCFQNGERMNLVGDLLTDHRLILAVLDIVRSQHLLRCDTEWNDNVKSCVFLNTLVQVNVGNSRSHLFTERHFMIHLTTKLHCQVSQVVVTVTSYVQQRLGVFIEGELACLNIPNVCCITTNAEVRAHYVQVELRVGIDLVLVVVLLEEVLKQFLNLTQFFWTEWAVSVIDRYDIRFLTVVR